MQKLVLLTLFFTLAVVCAKRPNYHKQGRSQVDVCRLNCVWDAVSCGFPCRLLFRSHRTGYFNCAKVCNQDRITCFKSCEKKVTASSPQAPAAEEKTAATEPKAAEVVEEEVDGEETGDSNESVED